MSRTLSTNSGSLESLKLCERSWLQTKGSPYPTDRRVRIAACRCHRTDRPMRGIFWRRTQRALDHSGNLIIIDRARPARASFIQEPFDAILQKPSTPFAGIPSKSVATRTLLSSEAKAHGLELTVGRAGPARGALLKPQTPSAGSSSILG